MDCGVYIPSTYKLEYVLWFSIQRWAEAQKVNKIQLTSKKKIFFAYMFQQKSQIARIQQIKHQIEQAQPGSSGKNPLSFLTPISHQHPSGSASSAQLMNVSGVYMMPGVKKTSEVSCELVGALGNNSRLRVGSIVRV